MKRREQSYRGFWGVVLPLAMAMCSVFAVCSCSDDEHETDMVSNHNYCKVTLSIKNEKGDTCSRFRFGENMIFCLDFLNTTPNDMVVKASQLFLSSFAAEDYGTPSMALIVSKSGEKMIGCPYDILNDEDVLMRAGQITHLECSWLQRSDGRDNSSLFICNEERQPLQPGRYSVETGYHVLGLGLPGSCSCKFEIFE